MSAKIPPSTTTAAAEHAKVSARRDQGKEPSGGEVKNFRERMQKLAREREARREESSVSPGGRSPAKRQAKAAPKSSVSLNKETTDKQPARQSSVSLNKEQAKEAPKSSVSFNKEQVTGHDEERTKGAARSSVSLNKEAAKEPTKGEASTAVSVSVKREEAKSADGLSVSVKREQVKGAAKPAVSVKKEAAENTERGAVSVKKERAQILRGRGEGPPAKTASAEVAAKTEASASEVAAEIKTETTADAEITPAATVAAAHTAQTNATAEANLSPPSSSHHAAATAESRQALLSAVNKVADRISFVAADNNASGGAMRVSIQDAILPSTTLEIQRGADGGLTLTFLTDAGASASVLRAHGDALASHVQTQTGTPISVRLSEPGNADQIVGGGGADTETDAGDGQSRGRDDAEARLESLSPGVSES
ncbi:MAG: hypothetical protein MPJ53_05725 [Alphaproteobacteria bacterium]|nr:hypothetical protein [Alphaproteobacteria bacterium]